MDENTPMFTTVKSKTMFRDKNNKTRSRRALTDNAVGNTHDWAHFNNTLDLMDRRRKLKQSNCLGLGKKIISINFSHI